MMGGLTHRASAKWLNVRFGHGRLSPRVGGQGPGVVAAGGTDGGVPGELEGGDGEVAQWPSPSCG